MDFGEDDAAARAARISHAQAVKSKLSDAKTRQRGQPYIKVDEFEAYGAGTRQDLGAWRQHELDRDAKYEDELEQAVYDQEMLDELEAMEEDESGQPKATKAKAGARVVVVYKEEEEDSGMSVDKEYSGVVVQVSSSKGILVAFDEEGEEVWVDERLGDEWWYAPQLR